MTITARKIADVSDNFTGTAFLWELSEPVGCDQDWETGEYTKVTTHVVTSAAVVPFSGPETYIFPADADGDVLGWLEMDGSYRGGLDHETAIAGAGWVVAS